jgi:hypothetical protein
VLLHSRLKFFGRAGARPSSSAPALPNSFKFSVMQDKTGAEFVQKIFGRAGARPSSSAPALPNLFKILVVQDKTGGLLS